MNDRQDNPSTSVVGRNIVLCCDGTNNQFGKENTNVIRLIQSLERDSMKQLLYYDPGVGTLPEPYAQTRFRKTASIIKGLAFGRGLFTNVAEAYTFLMEVWKPEDRVFLFGFSRGAYTVRALAGVLHALGLLPRGNQNLIPYAMRLYQAIQNSDAHGGEEATNLRKLFDDYRKTFSQKIAEKDEERHFRVHFLGLWDTVSSVGWAWDPQYCAYATHNPSIDIIRHAVALDERRWFFRQNLMYKTDDPLHGYKQDHLEYWFPGVHSDVGGGYTQEEGGLWRPPFEWILNEAEKSGLTVNQTGKNEVLKNKTISPVWLEPQHESLKWYWWPAEFFPKQQGLAKSHYRIPRIGKGRYRCIPKHAKIHESALRRLRDMSDYRPKNLSPKFIETVLQLPDNAIPEFLPYHP